MSARTETLIKELLHGVVVKAPQNVATCPHCSDSGAVRAFVITVEKDRSVAHSVALRPCGRCRRQDEDGKGKFDEEED